MVVLLFVPGTVIAVMLILQINGIAVNVQSWLNSAFALTIVAELYGIVKNHVGYEQVLLVVMMVPAYNYD